MDKFNPNIDQIDIPPISPRCNTTGPARDDQPARITVLHNGVVVHHGFPLGKKKDRWNLRLQDHGNPVRYRNIWVRELKDYR